MVFGRIKNMANWKRNLRRRQFSRRASVKSTQAKRILTFAKLGLFGVIVLFLSSFIIFPLLAFNLPSPDKVVRREGFSTKILDRNGEVLYDIFADERRTLVAIGDIPEHLQKATIAIEDKNFYKHGGFDPLGMIRGFSRVLTRGRAQGGSTLTQQLVKNVLLTPERSIFRKIREFVLAVQIERKFSKDEILQMYLNEAPYGGTAWGVEAAAETYFGKSVSELNLVESAFLAGLPQRPSVYSPYSSTPDAYIERTKNVLRRMQEDDYISKEEEDQALKDLENIEFLPQGESFKAPHFVQYVQKVLEERYGENIVEKGGLRVTTTLDLELQEEAEKIVAEEIDKVTSLDISNGAAVVVDSQTGEILSMVGSRGFSDPDIDGQVNVTTSLRQPGSSIKPFTYVTAFKKGYTPSTMLMDVETDFPGGVGQPTYTPKNYDGKYRGPMQLRYALANSINIVAVKVLALVGIQDTLETAYEMGIESLKPSDELLSRVGLSLTLGGGEVRLLELTRAYAPFMNGGNKVDPVSILKVEDADGKILEENEPKSGKRVLDEGEAYLIADILSDNNARADVFGTNSLLNIAGRQVAVKTGTTNDLRDNWAIGGTPQAVVGVWVGNNDNSPMKAVASGVSGASPIWRQIVIKYLDGKNAVSFSQPDSVVTASVDKVSGYRAHDSFPDRTEKFIKGTEPGEDSVHVYLKVCKNDGKLATPSDISSGNYDSKEYFVFKEEDPSGTPNKWQEAILAWANGQTDPRYHPPTDYCGSGNPLSISITSPGNESSNLANNFTIKMSAGSTSSISLIELFIDGSKVRSFTGPPYEYDANLSQGVHKIKAKAKDNSGNERETEITVGVGVDWNFVPPTPTPTQSPSPTPSPEPTP